MLPAPDLVSDTVAAITSRLVERHDGLTVLSAVTEACSALLSADATGVLMTDPRGGLEIVAASDERARFVELLQAQTSEGPCLDCITGNTVVTSTDLAADSATWPRFAPAVVKVGFHSVHAFPMRLMDRAVGGLNLFFGASTDLPPALRRLGQVLADLAVLGLTQERDQRRIDRLVEQTLTTVNDRARMGHAVGMVAGGLGITAEAARGLLAAHSSATGRSPRDVALAVTEGTLAPDDLTGAADHR